MIVADDEALKPRFRSFFGSLGYTIIQYSHPLKALDNLEEIQPDVLVCSASDYPRHWKLLVKHLRDSRERDDAVVILTVNAQFESEEADKAVVLGVKVLYPERLETAEDFRELDSRISRYKTPPERSKVFTWVPDEDERVSFIFRHPTEFRMISGRFIELSPAGGMFRPDDPGDILGLETGRVIESGSMRVGESLLTLKTRIIRNSGALSLVFIDFEGNGFQNLLDAMSLHVAII